MTLLAIPSSNGPRRVVYISYDGMSDPLGESQVLPYVRALADLGHSIELVSFEKPPHPTPIRKLIHPGVWWTGLRYHKEPTVPATAFDMAQGAAATTLLILVRRAELIHVRSYVAATLALLPSAAFRRPIVFDMRGLWPDERVEDGTWAPTGRIFRGAKRMERTLVGRAALITVLTNAMARTLREDPEFSGRIRAPIHVIPTCTDLGRFSLEVVPNPELRRTLGSARTLAYVGSFGGRYLAREMARFYLAWRQHAKPARFLVVSRFDPEPLRSVLREAGVESELIHRSASHDEVPALIRCAEAGVFFHPATRTNCGAAPTKMGEMLASGLAIATNPVGDVPNVVQGGEVGVVLHQFDESTLDDAARSLAALSKLPGFPVRARKTAERWFSLERGVSAYDRIYRALGRPAARALTDTVWPPDDPVS